METILKPEPKSGAVYSNISKYFTTESVFTQQFDITTQAVMKNRENLLKYVSISRGKITLSLLLRCYV